MAANCGAQPDLGCYTYNQKCISMNDTACTAHEIERGVVKTMRMCTGMYS